MGMTRKIGLLAAVAIVATLAGCSFSVGEPRNERVADAVQQGMEERGLEVIEISFEEDSDDRNIYMGEAVVRLEGSDEEIRSSCRVAVDEEQTISESDCPEITAAMRAANLENQIIQPFFSTAYATSAMARLTSSSAATPVDTSDLDLSNLRPARA